MSALLGQKNVSQMGLTQNETTPQESKCTGNSGRFIMKAPCMVYARTCRLTIKVVFLSRH